MVAMATPTSKLMDTQLTNKIFSKNEGTATESLQIAVKKI